MTCRHFPSGRFGYAMGYRSRLDAQEAFDNLCSDGEITPAEGRIESYQVRGPNYGKHGKTRYAITVQ